MQKERKRSQVAEILWKLIISTVGFALIAITLCNLLLFFFGKSTSAQVTTRRFGGSDDGRPASQRYSWSIDYTFKDDTGKSYNGTTTRRGGDISVKVENKVCFLSFAPFINALENEVRPNFTQILYIGLGIFLLFSINKKKNKRKDKKNKIKEIMNPKNPSTKDTL